MAVSHILIHFAARGREKLVFVWFCATDAGHDYGKILERGMRKLVVEKNGGMAITGNPNFKT